MILPDETILRVFHDAQLRRFGGAPGLRDAGLLEAAIGRVRSAILYREMDAVAAAAMLCHAVLKNHAFVDGNKRTAYGALIMTLAGNGMRLDAPDMDIADMILAAAAGREGFEAIEAWLRPRVARPAIPKTPARGGGRAPGQLRNPRARSRLSREGG